MTLPQTLIVLYNKIMVYIIIQQSIKKTVKKIEETGVVTNIERLVHDRFGRSAENIAIVSESVVKDCCRMCRLLAVFRN